MRFTVDPATPAEPPRAPRRRVISEWALLALVWLTVLGYAAYDLRRQRERLITQDLERLQGQTLAIEHNLVRQLEGVANALTGVRDELVQAGLQARADQLPARLKLLADAMPGVYALQVFDARGAVRASSRDDAIGSSFQTRAFIAPARASIDPRALYLSPPFQSATGHFTTVLARAIVDADDAFAGVVVAALDPDYFETVLRSAVYAQDARATMVHGDGTIIVSAPLQDATPGLNLNQPGSMFRRHVDARQPSSVQRGLLVGTGEHRLMAMRTIAPPHLRMDNALVVRVSRRTSDVLQPWRAEALLEALLLALGTATSAAWLFWHQHRRRLLERAAQAAAQAERESARRLEFGLRGADLGLWEWDLATDTVTPNAREMEMLGYEPRHEPLPAAFWRELMHPDDQPALEAVVREHLRGETPAYRIEHRFRHRDGRWIWVLDHAMVMERDAHGRPRRVVGTHLDISATKQSQLALETLNAQLETLSLTDGLTGVANRRQFDQALAVEWARGLRQRQPLALLMIDIDHFKRYNDQLGHPEGDACLRQVAQILSGCLRQPVERLMRYGGEEFAVLLADADAQAGARVAQRCEDAIAAAALPHPASPFAAVTVSIGVASRVPHPEGMPEELVHAADAALYQAKQAGRARVAVAPDAGLR
ncbi:hypothetical protein ASF43_09760 [Pseudorhodoferax sp. Leaf267]|nr:hypothetical protein ASF43_09760 [Pseudorhodoferax sp. Leaf267]